MRQLPGPWPPSAPEAPFVGTAKITTQSSKFPVGAIKATDLKRREAAEGGR